MLAQEKTYSDDGLWPQAETIAQFSALPIIPVHFLDKRSTLATVDLQDYGHVVRNVEECGELQDCVSRSLDLEPPITIGDGSSSMR